MTDSLPAFTISSAFQCILLGLLLGAIGQGIRAIVGLKKASTGAQTQNLTLKDVFNPPQLWLSLFIGALAGGLASVPFISNAATISYQGILSLIAAGYAGADFIEGFMKTALPKSSPNPLAARQLVLQNQVSRLDRSLSAVAKLLVLPADPSVHQVLASSFADPADLKAFKECKADGHSDQYCFKLGDNGIGFMGDDCTTNTPMCALPVEDWMEKWGSKEAARLKPVLVQANGKSVTCLMGDTMPERANINNGAGIDLSPAAVAALGLTPPIMVDATWIWA